MKAGIKTTEFWLVAITNIIAVLQSMVGDMSGMQRVYIMIAISALNALYAYLRTRVKEKP